MTSFQAWRHIWDGARRYRLQLLISSAPFLHRGGVGVVEISIFARLFSLVPVVWVFVIALFPPFYLHNWKSTFVWTPKSKWGEEFEWRGREKEEMDFKTREKYFESFYEILCFLVSSLSICVWSICLSPCLQNKYFLYSYS